MYGPHLKKVLREKGRMDISQCENTVQEMVSPSRMPRHHSAGADNKVISLRYSLKSVNLARLVHLR